MTHTHPRIRPGTRVDIGMGAPGLTVAVPGGGGATAIARTGTTSLWLALRGRLQLASPHGRLVLAPRQTLVWSDGPIGAGPETRGLWLVLAAPTSQWAQLCSRESVDRHRGVQLCLPYPGPGVATSFLRAALLRLAWSLRRTMSPFERDDLLASVMLALRQAQHSTEALAGRCFGRSYARRRQNLRRLLKVRNRILLNPVDRVDLATLAELAHYSPWHFIRSFRQAFGTTPVEYANRLKLDLAIALLRDDQLSTSEIAYRIGYESRSAFCRSFRRAFGMTTSQARARLQASAASDPCRSALA